MSDDEHIRGVVNGKFCAMAPCDHHDYRAPCKGTAAGWDAKAAAERPDLGFIASKFAQRFKEGARWRSHEAHHIACVASVEKVIIGEATKDEGFDGAVKCTDWCINAAGNMIALPLWPHTIQWYVNMLTGELCANDQAGVWVVTVGAPPFAGLAQHDYDHGRYIDEVNEELEKIIDAVNQNLDEHEDPSGNLAGAINGVVSKFQTQLKGRDTHASWQAGMNTPQGDWYRAFSMATPGNASERAFPAPGNRMARKISSTMTAFLKLVA